jgi:hypothetical protein
MSSTSSFGRLVWLADKLVEQHAVQGGRLRLRRSRFEPAQRRRRGKIIDTPDRRLQRQVAAKYIVIAHVLPSAAQAINPLRQHVTHAVRDAGMAAPLLKHARHRPGQSDPLIDLAQQQNPAIANDVAAVESSLDHTPSNLPQFDRFIGTIWHQRSSVVFGVRYQ